MNKTFWQKLAATLLFSCVLSFSVPAVAAIETSVEPFTGEQTYTSKYTFSDSEHNMHSIALIKKYKAIPGQQPDIQTYFLLNFTLDRSNSLGDSIIIQVSQRYINEIPLTPYIISGIGYSSVPTSRTGLKQLPPMTVAALEKGAELPIKVLFQRGSAVYTIPAEVVKEWADLLKMPTPPAENPGAPTVAQPAGDAENKSGQKE